MSYKDTNWNEYKTSYLKTFDKDVKVFTPSVYEEYRGQIWTTFQTETHPSLLDIQELYFTFHNRFSKSYKGVLRGLHWDNKTWKLVQAIVGDIYLVVLDMREDSPTFGKWESHIISEKNREQVLIPPGFANGHYALTDCIFHYTMMYKDEYVDVNEQKVVKWNDERFNIEWPTDKPILQKRDR
jgi:dTDP-4-dehydrorhamnose 3,5-epimerase